MKQLKGWDSYVRDAAAQDDRSIELPLTDTETYVIAYPSRKQGKLIADAQGTGDVDALLIALLGEKAGARVAELSADHPSYVLDEFLLDVMRKFGFVPEDTEDTPGVVDAGKSSSPRRSATGTRKRGPSR
jgi:hypothetical protein